MSCDTLHPLFPTVDGAAAAAAADLLDPPTLAVQVTPSAVVLVLWLGLEAFGKRAPFTRMARAQGTAVGLLASAAIGVLAWRAASVLECEGRAAPWGRVVAIGAPVCAALLLAAGTRYARIGIALSLAAAGLSVFVDWWIRSSQDNFSIAALPLTAVQHSWLLVAVGLMAWLPPGRLRWAATGRCTGTTGPRAVDPLSKRRRDVELGTTTTPGDRAWSWFA
jgi:hypothetical protein